MTPAETQILRNQVAIMELLLGISPSTICQIRNRIEETNRRLSENAYRPASIVDVPEDKIIR